MTLKNRLIVKHFFVWATDELWNLHLMLADSVAIALKTRIVWQLREEEEVIKWPNEYRREWESQGGAKCSR